MVSLLASAVVYGLAATGLAALVRKAPWPARWLVRKPLGCIVCMAGWSALAALVLAYFARRLPSQVEEVVVLWLASTGIAVYFLTQSGVFFSEATDPLSNLTERDP